MRPVQVQTLMLAGAAAGLVALGIGAGYWLGSGSQQKHPAALPVEVPATAQPERKPLYYQDPDGKPDYSPSPKKTADGRDYKPVYSDEGANQAAAAANAKSEGTGRILYYRNPMGLPDTSPVPKKDSMGMDYIPVHEGEEEAGAVTVSPVRLQTLGVRTAPVIAQPGLI